MSHEESADKPPEMDPTAASAPPESQDWWPSREDRATLIGNLQAQALQRSDPLSANLHMLNADLIACATRVYHALTKEAPDGQVLSAGFHNFERKTDLLLKLTRQIDRFANLLQQQGADEKRKS